MRCAAFPESTADGSWAITPFPEMEARWLRPLFATRPQPPPPPPTHWHSYQGTQATGTVIIMSALGHKSIMLTFVSVRRVHTRFPAPPDDLNRPIH